MPRRMLTDEIWLQLQTTMHAHGCYDTKKSRDVLEGILWKLRVGCPWEDIPEAFCPWKTAYNRFNRWSEKGLWDSFFLTYEEKLIRSGYSSTEATSALISMRAELEEEPSEPLDFLAEDLRPKSTWPVMRMETRSILKSLGVKFTMLKQPPKLFESSTKPKTSSLTKGTTLRKSANKPGREG
jgi:transposase